MANNKELDKHYYWCYAELDVKLIVYTVVICVLLSFFLISFLSLRGYYF